MRPWVKNGGVWAPCSTTTIEWISNKNVAPRFGTRYLFVSRHHSHLLPRDCCGVANEPFRYLAGADLDDRLRTDLGRERAVPRCDGGSALNEPTTSNRDSSFNDKPKASASAASQRRLDSEGWRLGQTWDS